jgi:hypothetical protein
VSRSGVDGLAMSPVHVGDGRVSIAVGGPSAYEKVDSRKGCSRVPGNMCMLRLLQEQNS